MGSECSHKIECKERHLSCKLSPEQIPQPEPEPCPVCNDGEISHLNYCDLDNFHTGAQPLYRMKTNSTSTCVFKNSDFVPIYTSDKCEIFEDSTCKGAFHYLEGKCCNNIDYPVSKDGWTYKETHWTSFFESYKKVGIILAPPCDQTLLEAIDDKVMIRMQEVPCTLDDCDASYFPKIS